MFRLQGVKNKNGKVQAKGRCLSLFTLYIGFFGNMILGFTSYILCGMPVWLASIYFVALVSIVGSSRFSNGTGLATLAQHDENNKYGVLEKMERSAKKYLIYIASSIFFYWANYIVVLVKYTVCLQFPDQYGP